MKEGNNMYIIKYTFNVYFQCIECYILTFLKCFVLRDVKNVKISAISAAQLRFRIGGYCI